ncbi:MAG: hypothetical protein Q7R74_00105 [bacterium]|nr:hypothetical protein [bacterium]
MTRREKLHGSADTHEDRRAIENAESEGMIPQHALPKEKPISQDEIDHERAEGEGMFGRGT